MICRCEVRATGGRRIATEDREIPNPADGAEVKAAMAAILAKRGLKPAGHTVRVYDASGRRPRFIQELSA